MAFDFLKKLLFGDGRSEYDDDDYEFDFDEEESYRPFWKRGRKDTYDEDPAGSSWMDDGTGRSHQAQIIYDRKGLEIRNEKARQVYINNCLEQIEDASRELGTLKREYNVVTSYLTDMEEVEALPKDVARSLKDAAKHLVDATSVRDEYLKRSDRMTDEEFENMERLASETEEGLSKIKEAEQYRKLIRGDLKRLDNERHAFTYRKKELEKDRANYKGMTTICFATMIFILISLLVLQAAMGLDVKIGLIFTVCVGALMMILFFVRFTDAGSELEKLERDQNRLINVQNTVKIRYVNNTQLIDYLYLKYKVESSEQLEDLWRRYQSEKKEREKYADSTKELAFYQDELIKILNQTRVKDPSVWLHQVSAILDQREMVEVRHGLIRRRQALRIQMDYNQGVAKQAQEEVKNLATEYPEYAQEIMDMVTSREEKEESIL